MNREQTKELIKTMQQFVDGGDVEFQNSSGRWVPAGDPTWHPTLKYRKKQTPDRLEGIEFLPDWVEWCARDCNGIVFVYDNEPMEATESFYSTDSLSLGITNFNFHTAGTCDWKDSKIKIER